MCVALFKIECSENFYVSEKIPFLGQNVKMKIDVSELGPGPKIVNAWLKSEPENFGLIWDQYRPLTTKLVCFN